MGAEVLPETNEYELLRFNCLLGIGVIYQGKRGISVSGPIVTEAFECYSKAKEWRGKGKPQVRQQMTQKQRQLLVRDGNECFYCGYEMQPENISVEHVLSRLHGGSNRMENLVLAHKKCNEEASHLTVIDKIRLREKKQNPNVPECG